MAYALDSKWLTVVLVGAGILAFGPVLWGGAMLGFALAVFAGAVILLVLVPLGLELGWDLHRTKSLGERSGSRTQDLVNPDFSDRVDDVTDDKGGR